MIEQSRSRVSVIALVWGRTRLVNEKNPVARLSIQCPNLVHFDHELNVQL